jgi:hypothetical protein
MLENIQVICVPSRNGYKQPFVQLEKRVNSVAES